MLFGTKIESCAAAGINTWQN